MSIGIRDEELDHDQFDDSFEVVFQLSEMPDDHVEAIVSFLRRQQSSL